MNRKMSSTGTCAAILLVCALTFAAAQSSCKGRCGAEYSRGYTCQCDYDCLAYGECCQDYEYQCTTKNSCKGRCGETFKRGRWCSCDADCVKFKQCCSDFTSHCDADEMSGAASEPGKTNSCQNVNDIKPKEPTLKDATEPASTFSEGNSEDDFLVSPTTDPQNDLSDDSYSPPDDGFPSELEPSSTPESTSGYEPFTAELLDQISTEPTLNPDPLEMSTETFTASPPTQSSNDGSQDNDSLSPTTEAAPTEGEDTDDVTASPADSGTTLPQSTTAADQPTSETTPSSVTQTVLSPTANAEELQTVGQEVEQSLDDSVPEAQNIDPTAASGDNAEVTPTDSPVATASTGPTLDSDTNSVVTGTPASSTLEPESIPEATTSPPDTQTEAEEDVDEQTTAGPEPSDQAQDDTKHDNKPEVATTDPLDVTTEPTKAPPKPQDKPAPSKLSPAKPAQDKPSSKPEIKPLDPAPSVDDTTGYQADDSNDTNLCSGRPVSAVTTLRNGTIVVFRGHYFWFLDRNMVPGPARGITQVWGVPSPIDTVFTRCNCQGKTYIFKGPLYWRFENDVLDSGYPKPIQTGFDGLRGHITAALSVPQYRSRRESVYFFKRGGSVQKYSYQFGTTPTCGRKPQMSVHTVRSRQARQAVSLLGPTINIRRSWRGFPTTVTAAVSIPNRRETDGYKYYVFSRSKPYNVRMDGENPVVPATSTANTASQNTFFKCPKKV